MIRLPFFGLLGNYSPMHGLMTHYEQIALGMELVEEAMQCIVDYGGSKSACAEFANLREKLSEVEGVADQIKRSIRNNMPQGVVLPVDRVLFLSYTRQQDDILDAGQDSLYWLAMRDMQISVEFQRELMLYIEAVSETIKLLRPALSATIDLVTGDTVDREEVKENYRAVRANHKIVSKLQNELVPKIFNSEMDFKEIYQLIHFITQMHRMSHNAEGCADVLRAMIAR